MGQRINWSYWCGVGMLIPLIVWLARDMGSRGYCDWTYLPLTALAGLIPVLLQAAVLHLSMKLELAYAVWLALFVGVVTGLVEIIIMGSCLLQSMLVAFATVYWGDDLSYGLYETTAVSLVVSCLLFALFAMLLQTPIYVLKLGYTSFSWKRLGIIGATAALSQLVLFALILAFAYIASFISPWITS